MVLVSSLLTKPMAKPIEAWRQFHEKATAWIVERRERLEDEGYEHVLDYSEFPMMDSLLPAEPLWDEEIEQLEHLQAMASRAKQLDALKQIAPDHPALLGAGAGAGAKRQKTEHDGEGGSSSGK